MFTSFDKAIAAMIPAILFLLAELFGVEFELSVELQTSIAGVLGAVLTYFVPNKTE